MDKVEIFMSDNGCQRIEINNSEKWLLKELNFIYDNGAFLLRVEYIHENNSFSGKESIFDNNNCDLRLHYIGDRCNVVCLSSRSINQSIITDVGSITNCKQFSLEYDTLMEKPKFVKFSRREDFILRIAVISKFFREKVNANLKYNCLLTPNNMRGESIYSKLILDAIIDHFRNKCSGRESGVDPNGDDSNLVINLKEHESSNPSEDKVYSVEVYQTLNGKVFDDVFSSLTFKNKEEKNKYIYDVFYEIIKNNRFPSCYHS